MAEGATQRQRQIADAALALLEEGGPDALSMRAVAARLGIGRRASTSTSPTRPRSRSRWWRAGFEDSAERFERAVEGADDPLAALGRAYRAFALERPHLYRLMNMRPLPRERLPEGLEARAARPLVEAAGGDATLARTLFALAHGLASLEIDDRFPPGADVEAAWQRGIEALRPPRALLPPLRRGRAGRPARPRSRTARSSA